MKESTIKATIQIGHFGLTPAIVEELRAQVAKKHVVKVKRLKSAEVEDEKAFWKDLAAQASVRLLEVRGHTAVFADVRYRTEREERRRR